MQVPVLKNRNSEGRRQDWLQQVVCMYAENWENVIRDELLGPTLLVVMIR